MTTSMVVAPDVLPRLEQTASKLEGALEVAKQLPVTNAEQAATATEIVRLVKQQWSELDNERKSVTQPALQIQRTVNGWFKGPLTMAEDIERILKAKIASWTLAERKAQVEAMRATAEAVAAGTELPVVAAPAREPERANVREVWDFEIIDPDAVPRALCIPDRLRIHDYIGKRGPHDPAPEAVPGIRFFLAPVVVVRR